MVECTLSITHCLRLNLQLHTIDLIRTCRISSFCTVAWQLARFQLTRRIARSFGDSWASCTCKLVHWTFPSFSFGSNGRRKSGAISDVCVWEDRELVCQVLSTVSGCRRRFKLILLATVVAHIIKTFSNLVKSNNSFAQIFSPVWLWQMTGNSWRISVRAWSKADARLGNVRGESASFDVASSTASTRPTWGKLCPTFHVFIYLIIKAKGHKGHLHRSKIHTIYRPS